MREGKACELAGKLMGLVGRFARLVGRLAGFVEKLVEKHEKRIYIMQWTDRIRQVKIVLFVGAIVLAVLSLVVSHYLVRDLYAEERSKMEIWSEAMRALNNADENTDLNLVLKVMNDNNTIPLIVMDSNGNVQTFRNLKISGCGTYADTLAYAARAGRSLYAADRYIKIAVGDSTSHDDVFVCYDDSIMLKRLSTYPYVQLGVVFVFVLVAIFALLTSKKAEQNKVWVGLSKETAHQLGTPISSLMAWTEILKETYPDDALIPEMDKDVKRLQLIADRFSKIGSLPEPVPSSLNEVMAHVVDYMDRRTSKKVQMICCFPDHDLTVKLNASLFEWVIENLCKNAVDAMEGVGTITLTLDDSLANKVVVEVADTGKGIKKRGWGLGLSLAKRIVEEYHHGRIFVKSSEVGVGTTFRIELKRS